jgi:hypothetical protein
MKYLIFVLFAITFKSLSAQQSINTTGGNTTNTSGSVSYSIGQLVCDNQITSVGSVRQGVQQVFEIVNISGVEQINLKYDFTVYPTPANQQLTLNLGNFQLGNTKFQIFNLSGKMIEEKEILNNIENIELSSLASSVYFIKIVSNNQVIKTFKIIKNQ